MPLYDAFEKCWVEVLGHGEPFLVGVIGAVLGIVDGEVNVVMALIRVDSDSNDFTGVLLELICDYAVVIAP